VVVLLVPPASVPVAVPSTVVEELLLPPMPVTLVTGPAPVVVTAVSVVLVALVVLVGVPVVVLGPPELVASGSGSLQAPKTKPAASVRESTA
jgi:hypothetical protein